MFTIFPAVCFGGSLLLHQRTEVGVNERGAIRWWQLEFDLGIVQSSMIMRIVIIVLSSNFFSRLFLVNDPMGVLKC